MNIDNTRSTCGSSLNEVKHGLKVHILGHMHISCMKGIWKGPETEPRLDWPCRPHVKWGGECSCWQTTDADWSQRAGLTMSRLSPSNCLYFPCSSLCITITEMTHCIQSLKLDICRFTFILGCHNEFNETKMEPFA